MVRPVVLKCTCSYLNANHVNESDSGSAPSEPRNVSKLLLLLFSAVGSFTLDEHRCPLVMWKHIAHVYTYDYLRNLKADYKLECKQLSLKIQ